MSGITSSTGLSSRAIGIDCSRLEIGHNLLDCFGGWLELLESGAVGGEFLYQRGGYGVGRRHDEHPKDRGFHEVCDID